MKKKILLLTICAIVFVLALAALAACNGVKMTISFIVDGETYDTIDTSGNEVITIPKSPTKDGYTFDGWYWDEGTWLRPFTANSLLNEPLKSDMSVYAKFTKNHEHELTLQPANASSCTEQGNNAYYTCTCGKLFADAQATVQLNAIPTINPTGHSYSADWTSDESGHWHVATCEHKSETTAVESHTYDSNYKCKVCHYQDTSLRGTAIATEVFDVDGETLYTKVPNTQTTFSFINAIQVADGATFVVATDLAASNVIRTKTVSLEISDNTYYVLVENGNDIQLYTVTLRRRPIYTVTFVTDGGTACTSQQVEEDSFATQPTTTKTGYTFAGWDYDFATPITANTTITASWTANTYTLTYNLDGGIADHDEYTATYDAAYTLDVPTREGYTFQGWYVGETKIANANGQSVSNWTDPENKTVTAKWSINSYTLTITNPNSGAGTVTGAGTKVYNSEVTVTATEPNLGYDFMGWYNGNELISNELTCTFNMPADALTLIVNYKVKDEMSNFDFTSTSTTCNITGVKDKTIIEVAIPNYVTSIGEKAFNNCSSLISIEIPGNVRNIGNSAFYECSNLESITVNEGVQYIGTSIFGKCLSLKSISIPFLGQTIEKPSQLGYLFWTESKFTICNNKNINDSNNIYDRESYYIVCMDTVNYLSKTVAGYTGLSYIGGQKIPYYSYDYAGHCIPKSLTSVTILGGEILQRSLYNCYTITDIVVPNQVSTIGTAAFSGTNISRITLPEGLTSIDGSAFNGCSSLTSITIPDSVTTIGDSAFYGCSRLTNIYYNGTADDWTEISIGSGNTYLTDATRYYYSATEPELNADETAYNGNYWYYNPDNEIVVWTYKKENN